VTWRSDHNCGGGSSSGRRALAHGEWEELADRLHASSFDELPAEIESPVNADGTITVVTDDTQECISVSETGSSRRVCSWSLALEQSPEGTRARSIIRLIKAIAGVAGG
jgi:hypothetical protein